MIAGFPDLIPVTQRLWDRREPDIAGRVRAIIHGSRLAARTTPETRVAIAVGSRGVANIGLITRSTVDVLRGLGAHPFIVPAMGSHGGATAEGQIQVLAELGITPEAVGAEIRSSMEVDVLGRTDRGMPVYFDRNAKGADAIVAINRVKKHTDITAVHESGLIKMLAIGLGKRAQAEAIHSYGAAGLREHLLPVARVVLARAPVCLGIATIENGYEDTAEIHGFEPEEIEAGERRLLLRNKRRLPRLPFDAIDVLIVDRMGKELSGTGMDTNVLGRVRIAGEREPERPRVTWIAVLDLTPASHGNAIGVGLADITTRRLVDRIDWDATYVNGVTSGFFERAKLPIVASSDRDAIATVFSRLAPEARARARVARIRDTLHLDRFSASRALLSEARGPIDVAGPAQPLRFDEGGSLLGDDADERARLIA